MLLGYFLDNSERQRSEREPDSGDDSQVRSLAHDELHQGQRSIRARSELSGVSINKALEIPDAK